MNLFIPLFSTALTVFAAAPADPELQAELNRLSELRKTIAAQKPTLAEETARIASDLSVKRREVEFIELDRSEFQQKLNTLTQRISELDNEFSYIDNLLFDYRKQFETQLPSAVAETRRTALLEADRNLTARLDLIEQAIRHFDETCSIFTFDGEALDAEGRAHEGRFLQAGPITWFISSDRKNGGLTVENRNLLPELVPGTDHLEELKKLLNGQTARPRFDPTEGSAIALDKTSDSWIGHIQKGGFWVYPILALALISTIAALGKWGQLACIRELSPDVIRNVLEALKAEDRLKAETALEKVKHPSKALLQRGIELSNRRPSDIEEGMYEKFLEAEPGLQRGLSFIAITSATAPLLGLLGTVTGMIYTFRLINVFGTGDAKSLASGISEALITTEMGLVVAIPALIMHALLSRRVQGIRTSMELTSLAFVNGLQKKERP
ncbi:MotA/TolQ/ExbB proton channel family protein [Pontiella agarivorans]|uniref:MotA/TolQ/ExbB proton channel family protein n=1 Tax=Pontiella agarivorans TaxID=3038953 RepID=A0ABU5MVL1_9BACT|nr:MotA/TolQ/ExbB proton channel family protein [Pontiella agarivorans]MDZ8118153.1 MotA/TolQ/ExbB proton channel family protein [Pontiella agarivorans]